MNFRGVSSSLGSRQLLTAQLAAGEIHVWLTYYDEIRDSSLLSEYRKLLDGEEKRRELHFYFAEDRKRYVVTRALVRTVLSKYVSVSPVSWRFLTNNFGRPMILKRGPETAHIDFNLSHTRGLIVLAVTSGSALGIDVENLAHHNEILDIAHEFFAHQEVAALMCLPIHLQKYRCLEYWTFKESYLKARGMGVSLPLDKFGFEFLESMRVKLWIDAELQDDATRWTFLQFQPTPEYLVALCGERFESPSALRVRAAIPLASERMINPIILRTSRR